MNDKVPGIDEKQKDRADLNIKETKGKSNKNVFTGMAIIIGMVVIGFGAFLAFNQFTQTGEEVDVTAPDADNYTAGYDKSMLDDDAYFEEMNKNKLRTDEAEAARLAREQATLAKLEDTKQQPKAVVIDRVSDTPPRQPPPTSRPTNARNSNKKNQPPTPNQRKQMGSVMVKFGEKQDSKVSTEREYDQSFNASSFADGSAQLRKAGALDFMLIHGTAIPCALYTQIISDYAGYVTCRVTQDIYSANGASLLVERGSMVSGTQKVAMEQGKARIFTNWADIETPLGVSIRIDSLGTGALGASGHGAWVDNHFAERFGGAIMLSFVDDALGALSTAASDNSNVQFDNSTQNASDMASKALESSINIAPTGYSYIGQRINILVARDIDLSSVYQFGKIR